MSDRPPEQPTAVGDDVSAVAVLQDPLRLALYEYVIGEAGPVSRDQAAQAMGVSREAAAFHLDRLASEGLLEVTFRRLSGKQGPGAGRPAKLYSRSAREVQITLPPRRYDVAARVFAEALASPNPVGAVPEVARAFGQSLGARALEQTGRQTAARRSESFVSALESFGYKPSVTPEQIAIRNCPFHAIAQDHRDVVCNMNRALITGLLAGLQADDMTTVYHPGTEPCCVTINRHREPSPAGALS